MNTNPQEEIERIFHNALDLPSNEREIYLERECADNQELRSEVESLLKSFESDADFLNEPVFEIGLQALSSRKKKELSETEISFYKIHEKIGEGGMGEVYRATDTRLNRRVAIKFLSDALANNKIAKRQFQREAQSAAALEHPNICAVYGIEEIGEHNFIVMQFIEGITLAEKLEKYGKIEPEEFKPLAQQILNAIAFAHSHDIIHRDLKPGNIMLDGNGQIKILDFGLAKILAQKKFFEDAPDNQSLFSSNDVLVGTISYISPEQLRGKKADYRSDIFALGVIFYEMLTGKNPFTRESKAETMAAVLTETPKPIEKFAPDVPENLRLLVERCLEKDTDKRFQSAAEILFELENTANQDKKDAKRKSRLQFFVKTAFAIFALFAVLFAAYFYYTAKPSPRTLAVMPIAIEQGLIDKEYLADGLTQSIIEELSNLSELKVKNQSIVAAYKGKILEAQNIGKELKADAVYLGSIISRGDILFLKAKLIRTSDGFVLDDSEFKVEESNLIKLPEDVALHVIEKIKTQMTDEDKIKFAKKDTQNPEAKKLYVKGRYYLNRRNGDDLQKAEQFFRQAVDLDSSFARAWSGLADTYSLYSVPGYKGAISPAKAATLSRAAAKTALELDDSLSEPYNSLGMIKLRYEWNWNEAEKDFREAIRRDSEFPQAYWGLSNLLIINGRYDEALEASKKAREFAPYSVSSYLNLAGVYFFKRDYAEMERELIYALEKFPNHLRLRYYQGLLAMETGKINEAVIIFEKIYEEDKILGAAPLGHLYAKNGRKDKTLNILEDLAKLLKEDEKNYVPSQEKAVIFLGLGEIDKVFEELNKACQEKFAAFPYIFRDPMFDEINNDARFVNLKKCANL